MKEILLDMSLLKFSSFSFSQDNDQGVLSHMPRDYAVAKKIGLILGVSLLQHAIINIFIQPSYFPEKPALCSSVHTLVRLRKIALFQWIFKPGPLSSIFTILAAFRPPPLHIPSHVNAFFPLYAD